MGGYRFDAELGRGITMNSVFELGGTAVNKNTAMAMSGGTNYEPSIKDSTTVEFKIKPIIPEMPKDDSLKKVAKEVLGKRRSRLVVIAWFEKGGKWLCRCDCGYFVIRHSSFLKKQNNFDACLECRFVIQKRRHNHWLATGKDLTEEYFA